MVRMLYNPRITVGMPRGQALREATAILNELRRR
jgi:hypothetical protein